MDFHSENDRDQLNCEPQEEVEQMEAVDQMEEVEEELCESAFIVEGIDMEAHKAVLAACSAYFRAIYREQKKRALKKNSRTTGWSLCAHFHSLCVVV